ncbi:MAG: zinc ribbon domain-containing protein [Planctomycetota bacterium]
MHPTMRALLDLHDVNQQRQLLRRQREGREQTIRSAEKQLARLAEQTEAAQKAAHDADALVRQYEQDIANAEQRIGELRERQMSAKTNKEYLSVINGIEDSKNIKKIREQKLGELRARIDSLQQAADQATQQYEGATAKVEEIRAANAGPEEADISEEELDHLYQEKRQAVDAKFLEVYERLVQGGHPMPLMPIDPVVRTTPYGNLISLNHIEQIRKGHLVQDHASAALLYVNEEVEAPTE